MRCIFYYDFMFQQWVQEIMDSSNYLICSWIVQSPLRQDHWLARSRYRHHLHFHHSPANHYIHMYNIYTQGITKLLFSWYMSFKPIGQELWVTCTILHWEKHAAICLMDRRWTKNVEGEEARKKVTYRYILSNQDVMIWFIVRKKCWFSPIIFHK